MRRIHVRGTATNCRLCLVAVTYGIEVTAHARWNVELAYCIDDTRSRIGMAKKRILDLIPIWRSIRINKELKMKLAIYSTTDSS